MESLQEAGEITQRVELLRGNPVWVEVHNVIPNATDTIEFLAKGLTVDRQLKLLPPIRPFKKPYVLAEIHVGYAIDFPFCFRGIPTFSELFLRKPTTEDSSNMVFNLAEEKERFS